MQARRFAPLAALAVATLAYALVRPLVALRVQHLAIVEFPVAAALVALCVLLALRPARVRRTPAEPWRKHRQVVRPLPDPEAHARAAALQAWAQRGADPDRAARILAQATGRDISAEMAAATSERKRRALLQSLSKTVDIGT